MESEPEIKTIRLDVDYSDGRRAAEPSEDGVVEMTIDQWEAYQAHLAEDEKWQRVLLELDNRAFTILREKQR